MIAGHTPGPWKISQNVTRHVVGQEGGVVACAELTWTNEITEANARLIAAAPELLEALQKIIDMNVQYCIDRYGDSAQAETMSCVTTARAVISKATGGAA